MYRRFRGTCYPCLLPWKLIEWHVAVKQFPDTVGLLYLHFRWRVKACGQNASPVSLPSHGPWEKFRSEMDISFLYTTLCGIRSCRRRVKSLSPVYGFQSCRCLSSSALSAGTARPFQVAWMDSYLWELDTDGNCQIFRWNLKHLYWYSYYYYYYYYFLSLKKGPIGGPMSVRNYHCLLCSNPEEHSSHLACNVFTCVTATKSAYIVNSKWLVIGTATYTKSNLP